MKQLTIAAVTFALKETVLQSVNLSKVDIFLFVYLYTDYNFLKDMHKGRAILIQLWCNNMTKKAYPPSL